MNTSIESTVDANAAKTMNSSALSQARRFAARRGEFIAVAGLLASSAAYGIFAIALLTGF